MNISICITTFNEEGSIGALLDSLLTQTKKADEIVIVDGGSTDKTVEIINHYPACISYAKSMAGRQKKPVIKFLISKGATRSEGRNLSIEIAKGDIIATTDAGCIAHKDWLEEITSPFLIRTNRVDPHHQNFGVGVDISAGFYHMTGSHPVNKAMSVFLGVTLRHFDINFLPSTRSMAFRRSAWELVGGFPEGRENSAEDTDFNYKAVKLGLKYARVKSAVVEWGMTDIISNFQLKIYNYAKWDARHGIWWHPVQGLASHNIHSLLIVVRYLVSLGLFIFCLSHPPLLVYWFIGLLVYLSWAYRKIYLEFGDWRIAVWGPFLQITCDFAVMSGFISGILGR